MQDQQADLEWRDSGVPVSNQFDDPYFSLDNGLEETWHVFLTGNELPARFCDGFHIGELGFGTGLGFLTAVQAWMASETKGHLYFTSFEAFPMTDSGNGTRVVRIPRIGRVIGPFGAPLGGEIATHPIRAKYHVERNHGRCTRNLAPMAWQSGCMVFGWLFARQKPRAVDPRIDAGGWGSYDCRRDRGHLYGGGIRTQGIVRRWFPRTTD